MVTRSQLDMERIDSTYAEHEIVIVVSERDTQLRRRVRRNIGLVLDFVGIRFVEQRNDIL
jgi:hypothetical protein